MHNNHGLYLFRNGVLVTQTPTDNDVKYSSQTNVCSIVSESFNQVIASQLSLPANTKAHLVINDQNTPLHYPAVWEAYIFATHWVQRHKNLTSGNYGMDSSVRWNDDRRIITTANGVIYVWEHANVPRMFNANTLEEL